MAEVDEMLLDLDSRKKGDRREFLEHLNRKIIDTLICICRKERERSGAESIEYKRASIALMMEYRRNGEYVPYINMRTVDIGGEICKSVADAAGKNSIELDKASVDLMVEYRQQLVDDLPK